ncbi:MAG: tetratricopeptide repeat protein [Candidatus Omnitrophica bacterium]|nr:tetratricopeptide repeat protein [Candidatus Omnitrophota bacterium]
MRTVKVFNFSTLLAVVGTFAFLTGFSSVATHAIAEPEIQNAQADAGMLQKEIERLKNEKEFETKRVEEMRLEREELIKEIRRTESRNVKQTQEVEELKSALAKQQESLDARMKKFEADLKDSQTVNQKKAPVVSAPTAVNSDPVEVEKQANEILQKGGDLDPEDEKFKEELARAHYNMGNVYFERGEYQRAVVEYYQAVDLMPYDADAHYNLAHVSGEFIGDQETALKHYQWYLYLKPNAQDRKLVEEKMVAARLVGRSHISSRLDKSDLSGNQNVAR